MIKKVSTVIKSVFLICTLVLLFLGLSQPALHAIPILEPGMEAIIKKNSPVHKKALEYLKQNDFDRVIEIERQNLIDNPNDLKSYLLLTLAYLGKDDEKSALVQVEHVKGKDPSYAAELYGSMARFYLLKKRYFKALHYFHESLKIDEKPAILNQVAGIYLAQGRLTKARQYFEKTMDTEPDYLNLARICLAEKDYPNSIQYAGKAVEQKPDMAEGYILLGTAYLVSDDLNRAESNFSKASELDPKLILADYNLGLIHLVQKKYAKALQNFTRIVELSPKIKEAYVCKAAILHISNDLKAAKKEADQAVNIDPNDFLGHVALGNIYLAGGDFASADKAYRLSGALFTEFTLPWFNTRDHLNLKSAGTAARFTLANIYHRNGLFRPEIDAIREGVEDQSDKNVFLQMMEARAEVKLGHHDRAAGLYQAAMKLQPKLVTPYMELGDLAANQDDLPEAVDYYSKALKIEPEMSGLYFILGDLYLRRGESRKAVANYQTGLKYAPKSSFGHNQIAWVLAEKEKKYKNALTHARRAHELNPKNARISDTLGWIYYRLKRYNDAYEIYRKIDRGSINDPMIYYNMGLVNEKAKKNREAMMAFESALNINDEFPQSADAKKRLEKLSKL